MSAPTTLSPDRPAWDSTPTRSGRRRVLVLLTVLALVPAVFATVLRLLGPTDDTWAMIASFIPYGQLGYPVALLLLLVLLVRSRHRGALAVVTVLVAALTALHVAWIAPFFVPDGRPVVGPEFTLLSQNVYKGQVDVPQLTQASAHVDLVVLSETTPVFLHALQTPQWQREFPYAIGDDSSAPADTSVFSRYPLTQTASYGHSDFTQWVTTVSVPGRTPVRLVAAHPCNPYCGQGLFAIDHALLEGTVRANSGAPLVVAGDLNAIDDHAPLVRLRSDGMRSAADLVGAGWVPTWPANRALLPPLLPIDHVLVNDRLTAVSLRTIHLSGTDHLGLVATLAGTR